MGKRTTTLDDRQAKRLGNAKKHFDKTPEVRRAEVDAIMADAGIDLNSYWIPHEAMFREINTWNYFEKPYKQRIPMPFKQSEIRRFISMPKARIGKVEHCDKLDKDTLGAFFVSSEDDGARNTLFAFSIVCDKNPADKYRWFNIKLDMCVGGKEWMPLVRLDSKIDEGHRNIYVDGKPVSRVEDMPSVDPPHLHVTEEFTQLYASNLGNDSQAYNQFYAMQDKEAFALSLNPQNPIFNSFLKDLAVRTNNPDPNCTATFTEIMAELARQQEINDPNFFRNCVCFVGAMTQVNVLEMFNQNVGDKLHFGADAPGVIDRMPIDLEDAVYGNLGGMA